MHVTCKTYPVQRSKGQSAVAGAAYRAGIQLTDYRQGKTIDFTSRAPDVREAFIIAPQGAPDWTHDREALWNRCEAAEVKKNGRPAREVQLGLAIGPDPDLQHDLVVEFATREYVDKDYIVDIAIHNYGQRITEVSDKGRATLRRWAELDFPFLETEDCDDLTQHHVKVERDGSGRVAGYKVFQPHAHIYVSGRPLDGDEFAKKKPRDFNSFQIAKEWRYEWPKLQNSYLEKAGFDIEVTAMGEDENPDPSIRMLREGLSQAAYNIEQRGEQAKERDALEFNGEHNASISLADNEMQQAESAPPEERHESQQRRMAAWWRNTQARFSGWREQFVVQAEIWKERFAQQKERLRSVFGQPCIPEHQQPDESNQSPEQTE